jgi:quercetin dioxygenase-like cupin family protein
MPSEPTRPAEASRPTEASRPPEPSEQTVRPVDLRDYVDFADEAPTRVRVMATDRIALDLWCLQPNQATGVLHLPDRDVTYTVVGGRSWFVTDQGEVGLDALGALLVPAGVVHGIDNRAPDPLIVLASSAPPSDEPEAAPIAEDRAAIRFEPDRPNPVRRAWESIIGVSRSE